MSNALNQYSIKSNISGDIRKWLSFGINMQLSYTKNNRVSSGYSGYNVIKAAVEQYPWDEPFLPNGDWATSKNVLVNNNALQAIKESDVWLKTYRALSNAYLNFHIIPGLDFKTSLGEDFSYGETSWRISVERQPAGRFIDRQPQVTQLCNLGKYIVIRQEIQFRTWTQRRSRSFRTGG